MNIIGYSSHMTSKQIDDYGKEIEEKCSSKYKKQMNCIHDWINTQPFCMAMDNNTKESWSWLRHSLINPPMLVIDKYESKTDKRTTIVAPSTIIKNITVPRCRLCKKKLADNILQKVHFSVILCKCDTLWAHVSCAEDFILENAQCVLCK